MKQPTVKEEIERLGSLDKRMRASLSRCTDEQVEFFNKLFGAVDDVTIDKLITAVFLCERTERKNVEDGTLSDLFRS